MDESLTLLEIRDRILAAFARERRWMGFYTARAQSDVGSSRLDDYCEAFARMVIRGELIECGHDGPGGFWKYIPASFLPVPVSLDEKIDLAHAEGFPWSYSGDLQDGSERWVCSRQCTTRQLARRSRSRKGGAESWHARSAS